MNRLYLAVCIVSIMLTAIIRCKPEYIEPGPAKPTEPVAIAGQDRNIYLPEQQDLVIDGSTSYDPNGPSYNLSYRWRHLSGPKVKDFTVKLATATMVIVDSGTYQFELEVKDSQSEIGRDTVTIIAFWGCRPGTGVFKSNYSLDGGIITSIPLDVSVANGAGKIVFAGGRTNQDDGWGGEDVYSSRFFVYDLDKRSTVTKELSAARGRVGIAVGTNEIFFAGGIYLNNVSDAVDVYDQNSGTVSVLKLSAPRSSVSCAIAGRKVFFAGGRNLNNTTTDVVDIFDMDTRSWSVAKLSIPRADISVISAGSKVFFVGGDRGFGTASGRIDIYDIGSGQWYVRDLAKPRANISSAVVGNNLILAGGTNAYTGIMAGQVEFVDLNSLAVTSDCISGGPINSMFYGPDFSSAVLNQTDFFYLSNSLVSRFESANNRWSVSLLPTDKYWVGLASNGSGLYAVSFEVDAMSNGYVGFVSIHRVSF